MQTLELAPVPVLSKIGDSLLINRRAASVSSIVAVGSKLPGDGMRMNLRTNYRLVLLLVFRAVMPGNQITLASERC